ncbi:hypothetical protein, partial [Pantoea graminicola]|uniref:hypothetical protein n=1 Tax=Pantoea sp. ARC607 TaxID=2027922 RepID=UPI001F242AF3
QIDIDFVFLFLGQSGKVMAHNFLLDIAGKSNVFAGLNQGLRIASLASTVQIEQRILLHCLSPWQRLKG